MPIIPKWIKDKLWPDVIKRPASKKEKAWVDEEDASQKQIRTVGFASFNIFDEVEEPQTRAVTDLDIQTDSAISGAMPQFLPTASVDSHGNPSPAAPTIIEPFYHSYDGSYLNEDMKKKLAILAADMDKAERDYEDYIMPEDGNWAGTFQPSLKPTEHITPKFQIFVTLGNPTKSSNTFYNKIKNSRGEEIHFRDNRDVFKQAIEDFNKKFKVETRCKIILGGDNNEYVNVHLTFDKFAFENNGILAIFEKYEIVATNANTTTLIDPMETIRKNCYFFLKGEIILNDAETEIESIQIFEMQYINKHRMRFSDPFIYV